MSCRPRALGVYKPLSTSPGLDMEHGPKLRAVGTKNRQCVTARWHLAEIDVDGLDRATRRAIAGGLLDVVVEIVNELGLGLMPDFDAVAVDRELEVDLH